MIFVRYKACASLWLNGGGVDIAERSKKFNELILSIFGWEIPDEQIGIFIALLFSFIFFGVHNYFNCFVTLFRAMKSINGVLRALLIHILNIPEASASSILENFEFA